MTLQSDRAQVTMLRILFALERGPMTLKELSSAAFIGPRWAKVYIDELRRLDAVHISSWTRQSHGMRFFYVSLGAGVDVKRPKAMTGAAKTAAYRKRLKQSGEWEHFQSRSVAREHADRVARKAHGWADALGVAA